MWQGYHSRVLLWSSLISPLIFSGLLQNICLKKSESLAQSYLKQKIATLVTEDLSCSFLFRPVFSVSRPWLWARYAQDHKIKFPMLEEEYLCNIFKIF